MSQAVAQEIAKREALRPILAKIKELSRITLVKHNQGEFLACPCGNMAQNLFSHYKKTIIGENRYELACLCNRCQRDTLYSNILYDKTRLLPSAPELTWLTGYVPSLSYIVKWWYIVWFKPKLNNLWQRKS